MRRRGKKRLSAVIYETFVRRADDVFAGWDEHRRSLSRETLAVPTRKCDGDARTVRASPVGRPLHVHSCSRAAINGDFMKTERVLEPNARDTRAAAAEEGDAKTIGPAARREEEPEGCSRSPYNF